MTDERNAARAEAERLAAVVKDMGYSDKARDHFVEKGMDAKDAKWAADIALPTMKASEVEVADIGTFLDEKFAKLYPTGAGSDGQPPPDSATGFRTAVTRLRRHTAGPRDAHHQFARNQGTHRSQRPGRYRET